jgi:hypothetical protein
MEARRKWRIRYWLRCWIVQAPDGRIVASRTTHAGAIDSVWNLIRLSTCPGCGELADVGQHGPNQGYGGCV